MSALNDPEIRSRQSGIGPGPTQQCAPNSRHRTLLSCRWEIRPAWCSATVASWTPHHHLGS